MTDWQERLRQERAELSGRLDRLRSFLDAYDNRFDDPKQQAHVALLTAQRIMMEAYLQILDQRLAMLPLDT